MLAENGTIHCFIEKICKNRRKFAKIAENLQKSPKICKNRRKFAKIAENLQKPPKIGNHNVDPGGRFLNRVQVENLPVAKMTGINLFTSSLELAKFRF
jgi:hypothetical protein